jgi:hypothetical protein
MRRGCTRVRGHASTFATGSSSSSRMPSFRMGR